MDNDKILSQEEIKEQKELENIVTQLPHYAKQRIIGFGAALLTASQNVQVVGGE